MNLSTVKAITIPEGSVKRILVGGNKVWEKRAYTLIEQGGLCYQLSEDGIRYTCVGVGDGVTATSFTIPSTLNGLPVAYVATDAFAGLNKPTVHISSAVDLTNAPWGATTPNLYIDGIRYRVTTTTSRIPQYVVDAPNSSFKGGVVNILGRIGSIVVSELDSGSFKDYTSITEVVIPAEIKWIETNIFQNCTNLKKATFKGKPSTTTTSIFSGCTNLTEIYVPWAEGEVTNAPWGATDARIFYQNAYSPIEYIETDGTQYIDTGVLPNPNSRVICDFQATDKDSENHIFGSRASSTSRVYAFSIRSSGTWRFGYGSSYTGSTVADTNRHTVDVNKNVCTLDGSVLYTKDYEEFTGAYTIHISAIKASSVYEGRAKIYSCQIYDNGTLVRDYVPCINAKGETGMWDKVNNVFYGNAGSGTFVTSE